MIGFNGGLIGGFRDTANGTASAPGVWTANEQVVAQRRGAWVSFGFLFVFPGAAAAYSLRALSPSTSNVIRVRRSSDNTEQDFTAAQIESGSIVSFCGAGNGFVTTWYDQSGNNRNLAQSSASLQPQIVSNGVLVTKGTKPAIDFNGSTHRLINSAISLAQPVRHFVVASRDSANKLTGGDGIIDSYNNTQHIIYNKGSAETPNQAWVIAAGQVFNSANPSTTDLVLINALFNSASSELKINAVSRVTGNIGTNSLSGLSVGAIRGNPDPIFNDYYLDGKISEIIIYPSAQSSNSSSIEDSINSYYGIY